MLHQLLAEGQAKHGSDQNHNKLRSIRPNQVTLSTATVTCPECTHSFPLPAEYQQAFSEPSKAVIYTTWGDHNTEEKVKASPYHTAISLPKSDGHNALLLHAVYPVPNRYLRTLAPEQLESLKIQLTTNVNYGMDMRDRVSYTVDAINEALGDDGFLGEQMRRALHSWNMC